MKGLKPTLSALVLAMAGITTLSIPNQSFAWGLGCCDVDTTYWFVQNDLNNRMLKQNQDNYKRWYGSAKPSKKSGTKKSTSKASTSSKSTSKSTGKSTSSSNSKSTTKAPDYSNAHRYTHSNSVSSQLNSQMIDTLRQDLQSKGRLTSQAAADLDRLSKSNLIGQVKNALKSDGYDPNSIATAMAYWVVVNYGIATRSDLASLKGHGMVEQLKDALSDESIANMSASDKQTMAETLYWLGSLQMAMYIEAVNQNHQTAINQRVQEAKSALSNMGLSTSNIRHGSRGLELG
ncbi:MAG: hypothetical protein Q4A69_09880 [Moraxella sp.]|nr:hypothetical protein [Moraxella sp.]